MRPGHPAPWVPPWQPGLPQAPCQGPDCRLRYGRLCVSSTLTKGCCASCAQRLGLTQAKEPDRDEQLALGL